MALRSPCYPVSLVLGGRRCLVVGGGRVASRKVEGLVAAGAEVTVVAPEVHLALASHAAHVATRPYRPGEAAGYFLAVAATGLRHVDRRVAADAEAAGVLVNVADDPEACSFVLPAVLRHGPVSVAVSSDATSPALSSWLRDMISRVVGPEVALLASLLGEARASIRSSGRSSEGLAWRALLDGPLPGLVVSGDLDAARALLDSFAAPSRPLDEAPARASGGGAAAE